MKVVHGFSLPFLLRKLESARNHFCPFLVYHAIAEEGIGESVQRQ
ncbi:hypothetical protein GS8_3408 [Geobacillus stearothermophilus]|uniref:Uncharacterized protein n=1 Tax=Geobacillus stearothermophilus TaxID=1422 RepID=A0ABQ7HAY2_GEOSE|nr:hypothetical protein GS8_3408 [Geobacillus stearothermophilus]